MFQYRMPTLLSLYPLGLHRNLFFLVDMMAGFYLVEDINVVERLQETEFSFVKLRFGFLCGIGHPFRECVFEIE